MIPAIPATRTYDLQSDEAHAQRLPWLNLFTSDCLAPVLPSTTSLETDDAEPQADHGCSLTFIHNEQRCPAKVEMRWWWPRMIQSKIGREPGVAA